ncbi:MAG: hypothetical protein JJE52_09755 [Acidimicrobiia bacterium]|nr:hypothetical protein [Acidimicrobiia bacterium]
MSAPAGELHAREIPDDPEPTAWFLDATRPAVVLGSSQPAGDVDGHAVGERGVDLVSRRSGGGAVLVVPGGCTWLDLIIPSGHPLWLDDVGRAMHWVGEVWCSALAELGVAASVHRGAMRRTEWSSQVCFAGLGAGEVLDQRRRKIVGVSQRRTRDAARFQTVAYHSDPADLVELLALEHGAERRLRSELAERTASVPVQPAGLAAALERHLPIL